MGSGTDVARESSDVVLLGNDLLKFVETVRIARRCRRVILTNFTGTLLVDGVGVGLAAVGLLNPLLAAFIHVSSEMVFILNSARLLPQCTARGGHKRKAAGGGPALVAWGFWKELCKTRLAAAAELAGSGTSPIRAGYRKARPTAHHVQHAYSLPAAAFLVHGPGVPSWRYFCT